MDQRFQQTLNFNLNNVPVRFNLSSTQPLPENFVVNMVRSLVRNASTAIGYNNAPESVPPISEAVPAIPPASVSDQSSSMSTSIPMWNQQGPPIYSNAAHPDVNESNALLVPPQDNEQQNVEDAPPPTGQPTNQTNQPNVRTPNTGEIINSLLPHIITASRILIVLFGKHLSGYFLDLALCVSLIFSYLRADEVVKRLAYSDQLLSWRTLRSVLNNLFLVASGLALTVWLYSPSDVFWLFLFYVDPENWSFGNFVTTATTIVMINYFIKCCNVFCKLIFCLAVRCKYHCLPLLPIFLNCLDVFGHLYLSSVVVSFWFVYVMRADGNFGVGIAIFVAYIVSRVPYFLGLLKDCVLVIIKLFSCRTYGRRATPTEIEQASGCAICLQDGFRVPTVVSCNHVFCHSCISRWLLENRSCPVCRQNLITGNDNINFQGTRGVFFM